MTTLQKADGIRNVMRYLQKFKNALVVIYIDDKIINSPLYSSHIKDIALLHQAGLQVVIIPGARSRIDQVLSAEKIKWEFNKNIRVTTAEAMPLIKMAAFDVSNIVMTSLAANNITAIIGNWVRSRAKGVINGFDYGTAGEIDKLEVNSIKAVLNNGFIPIFPCIGWNAVGHPYNISSILLAEQVAVNLGADKLFFMLENGGLKKSDYKVPEGVAVSSSGELAALDIHQVDEFIDLNTDTINRNTSEINLLSLLRTSQDACNNGVSRTHIVDGNIDGVLPCEIFSDLGSGTMIYTNNYGKIRPMVQTDIPTVLGIMRPFIQEGKLLNRSEKEIEAQMNDFIVYELDGGVHACACLHVYSDNQAEIAAVAVDENFAHMGIGPKLVTNLIERATKLKCKSIFIMTTQSADWFESLGFEPDSVESLPEERRKIWTKEHNSKVYRLK